MRSHDCGWKWSRRLVKLKERENSSCLTQNRELSWSWLPCRCIVNKWKYERAKTKKPSRWQYVSGNRKVFPQEEPEWSGMKTFNLKSKQIYLKFPNPRGGIFRFYRTWCRFLCGQITAGSKFNPIEASLITTYQRIKKPSQYKQN